MKHTTLAIAVMAVMAVLAAPVATQNLTIRLPAIDFPDDDVTTSSGGCGAAETAPVCVLEE